MAVFVYACGYVYVCMQVGLLVYLAHVGCFLPCERAIIGLTDRILTRVASTETVATPLSSFALDLNQVWGRIYVGGGVG